MDTLIIPMKREQTVGAVDWPAGFGFKQRSRSQLCFSSDGFQSKPV